MRKISLISLRVYFDVKNEAEKSFLGGKLSENQKEINHPFMQEWFPLFREHLQKQLSIFPRHYCWIVKRQRHTAAVRGMLARRPWTADIVRDLALIKAIRPHVPRHRSVCKHLPLSILWCKLYYLHNRGRNWRTCGQHMGLSGNPSDRWQLHQQLPRLIADDEAQFVWFLRL